MNLPLHYGWLGALEAGLIALAVGMLAFQLFHALAKKFAWNEGHSIGWSCVAAVAIAAGIDIWNLFYMGVVRLESPVHARMFLQKIHDANGLGIRVFMEIIGAVSGVALGWMIAHRHQGEDRSAHVDD
ncbi:hypothetical protein CO641_04635 [Lysobacteraceae bacterium NML91-0213]|nr:hypothetical protein CO641_04635 [Xanthomonadaceae bacterium NML91-0213]